MARTRTRPRKETDELDLINQVFHTTELIKVTDDERIDLQITAFAATIIKATITPWYAAITDDQEFILELRQVIQTALQRLYARGIDLEDVPALIEDHLEAIDFATRNDISFHTIRLSHELSEWTQVLVSKVLPLLVDTQSPPLRVLLSEILELIIYKGLLRVSEPSFIWSLVQPTPGSQGGWPIGEGHVPARYWSLFGRVAKLPWLYGILQWLPVSYVERYAIGRVQAVDVANLLQRARHIVFPGGAMAPAQDPPTQEEIDQLFDDCSETVVQAVPSWYRGIYFGVSDDKMQAEVKRSLAVFNDASINQVLFMSLVELVVSKLFPEFA